MSTRKVVCYAAVFSVATASSPVARDHWGIFELIIKESGDEGSDGKGRKSPLSLLFLPITPRSRSTLVPIIPPSRFSRAREFPNPHLALGKPVEEAGVVTQHCVADYEKYSLRSSARKYMGARISRAPVLSCAHLFPSACYAGYEKGDTRKEERKSMS